MLPTAQPPQGRDKNTDLWYATTVVVQHQGSEVRDCKRLIGTQKAGNLMIARALESAETVSRLTLIDWRADGRSILDNLTIITTTRAPLIG